MMGLVLGTSLLLQGAPPSIGDTIWVRRTVRMPAGHTVRATNWEPSDPVQLLGPPRVVVAGDSAEIAYPVVLWRPGRHILDVPGPLLLGPGGTVDSLRHQRFHLQVRSVLPPTAADSALSPQPRASLVPRQAVSPVPLILLWLTSLALLLPVHLWWRRRGRPGRAPPLVPATDTLDSSLARWADAGEYRAVAHVATAQLRTALAARVPAAHPGLDTERLLAELAATRPEWPLAEIAALLRSLDNVRFGVVPAAEALALSRSTMLLRDRVLRDAA